MRIHWPAAIAAALRLTLTLGAPANAAVAPELLTELLPLIETGLASDDVAVQSWAVRAAAATGNSDFESTIVAALENTNAPVRLAAATSLIRMGQEVSEARALLTNELVSGDAQTRGLVLNNLLYRLGDDVREDVLGSALSDVSEADVLRQLVAHVAQRGEGDVHALLERAERIDDAALRAVYIEEIQRAARPEGVAIAATLLDSGDADKRLEGAEIAFAINNVDARQLLEPLLGSSNAELAQRVGFHLARYGNAPALGRTAELALNAEMPEDLRMDAMALLRDNGAQFVSWDQLQGLLEEEGRNPGFYTRVYELAGATGDPAALEQLRGLLNGLFADERLEGIAGYGYAGQLDGIETMQEIVGGSGDLSLRLRAAAALGHIGGDAAAEALIAALRSARVDDVKVAIVTALGETGSRLAAQPVANTFALQNNDISLAALDALLLLGSSEIASQIESAAVAARTPEVRWRATVVLTHLDAEIGRIRLMQALDRPPEGFMDDLAGLPPGVLDAIDERLLNHSNQDIRDAALFRVMRRPDGGYAVLHPLVEMATSPDVRRQAIAVVTAAGHAEDASVFETMTRDTDRAIRLQGFAALAELADPEFEEFFRGYLNHADVALRLLSTYGLLRIHADDV